MKYFFLLPLLAGVLLTGCGSDDGGGGNDEQVQAARLAGTWKLGETGYVALDGGDKTAKFSSFSMRFTTSHAYTVLNDPDNVFYPTGVWQFVSGDYGRIILNGTDTQVALTYESDDVLVLNFTVSSDVPVGQRAAGISGDYEFRLERQ